MKAKVRCRRRVRSHRFDATAVKGVYGYSTLCGIHGILSGLVLLNMSILISRANLHMITGMWKLVDRLEERDYTTRRD